MRRYDALSSTPKYLLSSVILLYKLKVFHESSIRQGFLQMEKIFTFVLLSFCGLAQGVQQCLYCTSGESKQKLLLVLRLSQNLKKESPFLSDPDGDFHDYNCAVGY